MQMLIQNTHEQILTTALSLSALPAVVSFGQVSRKLHIISAYLQQLIGDVPEGTVFEFEVLAKGPGDKEHGIGPTCPTRVLISPDGTTAEMPDATANLARIIADQGRC
jgi:hypothetical protein